MKLLIVEDDRMLNDGITLSLKADADAILQACTLAEAEKLFAEGVDLVILDINLPDAPIRTVYGVGYVWEKQEKSL